jgi:hypothetical protein
VREKRKREEGDSVWNVQRGKREGNKEEREEKDGKTRRKKKKEGVKKKNQKSEMLKTKREKVEKMAKICGLLRTTKNEEPINRKSLSE